MKRIRLTLQVIMLVTAAVLIGTAPALAAASQTFHLTGIEISPGTTTIDASTSTYTTAGIHFVGIANGEPRTKWTALLNLTGPLDPATGLPEVCNTSHPVSITGGTWVLQTAGGVVGGQITGGALAWRPDGPGATPVCPGPVPIALTLNVTFATGRFRSVTSATATNAFLDHNFFPPRAVADLTLSSP